MSPLFGLTATVGSGLLSTLTLAVSVSPQPSSTERVMVVVVFSGAT
jgi:hypothetical protein